MKAEQELLVGEFAEAAKKAEEEQAEEGMLSREVEEERSLHKCARTEKEEVSQTADEAEEEVLSREVEEERLLHECARTANEEVRQTADEVAGRVREDHLLSEVPEVGEDAARRS